jgi:hypothetical protein
MSLYSSMSPKAIQKRIERDQTTGEPISADAQQRVADITALAAENVKAWKLAESMPDLAGMFQAVNDMTAEEQATLEEAIIFMEGMK